MSEQRPGVQKYMPVTNLDTDQAARSNPKPSPPPQRLAQRRSGQQETERMPGPHVPVVNPVTGGDRSVAMNSCRIYEKGRKNRTRS